MSLERRGSLPAPQGDLEKLREIVTCTLCGKLLKGKIVSLPCQHHFHQGCFEVEKRPSSRSSLVIAHNHPMPHLKQPGDQKDGKAPEKKTITSGDLSLSSSSSSSSSSSLSLHDQPPLHNSGNDGAPPLITNASKTSVFDFGLNDEEEGPLNSTISPSNPIPLQGASLSFSSSLSLLDQRQVPPGDTRVPLNKSIVPTSPQPSAPITNALSESVFDFGFDDDEEEGPLNSTISPSNPIPLQGASFSFSSSLSLLNQRQVLPGGAGAPLNKSIVPTSPQPSAPISNALSEPEFDFGFDDNEEQAPARERPMEQKVPSTQTFPSSPTAQVAPITAQTKLLSTFQMATYHPPVNKDKYPNSSKPVVANFAFSFSPTPCPSSFDTAAVSKPVDAAPYTSFTPTVDLAKQNNAKQIVPAPSIGTSKELPTEETNQLEENVKHDHLVETIKAQVPQDQLIIPKSMIHLLPRVESVPQTAASNTAHSSLAVLSQRDPITRLDPNTPPPKEFPSAHPELSETIHPFAPLPDGIFYSEGLIPEKTIEKIDLAPPISRGVQLSITYFSKRKAKKEKKDLLRRSYTGKSSKPENVRSLCSSENSYFDKNCCPICEVAYYLDYRGIQGLIAGPHSFIARMVAKYNFRVNAMQLLPLDQLVPKCEEHKKDALFSCHYHREPLCELCVKMHALMFPRCQVVDIILVGLVAPPSPDPESLFPKCQIHNEKMDLHCLTCKKDICYLCTYEQRHRGHHFELICYLTAEQKTLLSSRIMIVERQQVLITEEIERLGQLTVPDREQLDQLEARRENIRTLLILASHFNNTATDYEMHRDAQAIINQLISYSSSAPTFDH